MHLVIDDQPPVVGAEDIEMGEIAALLLAVRDDVVGGDGDGADFLFLAAVLADILLADVGLVEDFISPLANGKRVGDKNQGLGADDLHHTHADNRLARAARQYDDPRAPFATAVGVEDLHGKALVVPHGKRVP